MKKVSTLGREEKKEGKWVESFEKRGRTPKIAKKAKKSNMK